MCIHILVVSEICLFFLQDWIVQNCVFQTWMKVVSSSLFDPTVNIYYVECALFQIWFSFFFKKLDCREFPKFEIGYEAPSFWIMLWTLFNNQRHFAFQLGFSKNHYSNLIVFTIDCFGMLRSKVSKIKSPSEGRISCSSGIVFVNALFLRKNIFFTMEWNDCMWP